jgi:serine/threonine protein kinase
MIGREWVEDLLIEGRCMLHQQLVTCVALPDSEGQHVAVVARMTLIAGADEFDARFSNATTPRDVVPMMRENLPSIRAAIRGAASRLDGRDLASVAAKSNTAAPVAVSCRPDHDDAVTGAPIIAAAVTKTESTTAELSAPQQQSWLASGNPVEWYFYPSLDINTSIRGDTSPSPLNAVMPMVTGGTTVVVDLICAFFVNCATVSLAVVDEDGDPLPEGIITEIRDETEQAIDEAKAAAAATAAMWRPLKQLQTCEAAASVVRRYAIDVAKLPKNDDGIIVRLMVFVTQRPDETDSDDDDVQLLMPTAADAEPVDDDKPLCAIVSRSIVLRSNVWIGTQSTVTDPMRPPEFKRHRKEAPRVASTPEAEVDFPACPMAADVISISQLLEQQQWCPLEAPQNDHTVIDATTAVTERTADFDEALSVHSPTMSLADGADISRLEAEPRALAAPAERVSELPVKSASYTFWTSDLIGPDLQVLDDEVFIDPGRCNGLHCVRGHANSPSIADEPGNVLYQLNSRSPNHQQRSVFTAMETAFAVNFSPENPQWHTTRPPRYSSEYDNRPPMEREVLVVDWDRDGRLRCIIDCARRVINGTFDIQARAQALAWYVTSVFGGPGMDGLAAEESLLSLRKALDTQRAAAPAQTRTRKAEGLRSTRDGVKLSNAQRRVRREAMNLVNLGSVRLGLCRHRALLYKILCDEAKVPCFLMRGDYDSSAGANGVSTTATERHTWNIVLARGQSWLVDTTLGTVDGLQPWPHGAYIGPVLPTVNYAAIHDLSLVGATRMTAVEECGSGVSAIVRRCTIGGLTCAVKLPRDADDFQLIRKEFLLLQTLADSKHIVQVLGWRRGIVMEFMPHSLLSFVNQLVLRNRRVSRTQRVDIIVGVLSALQAVHARRHVHRDVKAENVLVAVNRCDECKPLGVYCDRCKVLTKLTDFADAVELPNQSDEHPPTPPVGTCPYAAPEIEAEVPFGCAADMWSVGMLAVELQQMELPSARHGHVVTHQYTYGRTTKTVKVNVPKVKETHKTLLQVVTSCLNVNWRLRPTAAGAIAALLAEPSDAASC